MNCREMMGLILGCYIFPIKPKNYKEALSDELLINAMKKELSKFGCNEVWDLV